MTSQSHSSSPNGPRLDGYTILAEIGAGSKGKVYKADQHLSGRIVAIKVLSAESAGQDERSLARFMNEARTMARMKKHDNIVKVFDFQKAPGDEYCIVMEFVDGRSLAEALRGEDFKPSPEESARIVRDAARALQHAHEAGVIHRDVSPGNILLAADGTVKMGDFGVARAEGQQRMTMAGEQLGAPLFASPEQLFGREEVDTRTDIYSLGAILYLLLTGRHPFEETNLFKLMSKHKSEEAPAPIALVPDLSPALEKIVQKAIAKERDNRYQTAADMEKALSSFLEKPSGGGMFGRLFGGRKKTQEVRGLFFGKKDS
jgi:serine/threonine protein kinase